jgi:hypothetical protein
VCRLQEVEPRRVRHRIYERANMKFQYNTLFLSLFLFCSMSLIMSTDVVAAEKTPTGDMEVGKQVCEKKENLLDQILCFAALATKHDDFLICNAASHEGVKYQCFAIYAERRSNPDVCEEIPPKSSEHKDLRDSCISDVAKQNGDFTLCEKVQAQGLRDSCYWGIAKQTGDTSLCEKIQDSGLKSGCTGKPVYID